MKDLIATSVAQNRNMATDRAQGQNLGTRPKLGHYVRLQGAKIQESCGRALPKTTWGLENVPSVGRVLLSDLVRLVDLGRQSPQFGTWRLTLVVGL